MPHADADSQARLELPSPTVVREWRAETKRQIILNYEDRVNKWQERMLHQHMPNQNFPRQDVLPISNIAKVCGNVSTVAPTGVEDMESVDSVSSNSNDGRGRDSNDRGLFAGVAKVNGANDVCDGDVTWGSLHTCETAYACNNSGKNVVDAQEKFKSEKAAEQRLGAGPYRSSNRPTLVGRRSKSPDVSIAESTGTFQSKISVRNMNKVKETQPLGGPKYYIMTNTKKGKAKVVHEAMPATGREGFKLAMEEKGYEIIEYDMLPEGAKEPLSVHTPSNSTSKMEGVEFLQTNLLTGMFKSRQALQEKQFSMRMQRSTGNTKESSCLHFDVPISIPVQTGRNSLQSWFNEEFNKFLDVADKIDHAITGCTTADDDIADNDGDYSPTSEEEGDEDVTPHGRYRGRSSRHRRGRSRTRR